MRCFSDIIQFAMKYRRLCCVSLSCLLISGCQTLENNSPDLSGNVKIRGVYTTLAVDNQDFDMPGSGYVQKVSFGPGETPAAVILGYGDYNQPQAVSLELIESSTGRSLLNKNYEASYGRSVTQPLPIRLSGDYQLKLRSGQDLLDACQFTVIRTNNAETTPGPGVNYAHGYLSVSMETGYQDLFNKYDEKLIYNMANSMNKVGDFQHGELLAQRFPGKVVIQCRLDFNGRILDAKIIENTLDDACGEIFQKALLDRCPYDTWPTDIHQQFGSDSRNLTLAIRLD
jgi:hypothetical protein